MINILLSTFNGAKYLAQQLDSILAQSYSDWRLLVRDDGSTDNTRTILQSYSTKDPRISIIQDGENVGAMRSFERLLTQHSEAAYYAFCDQDDVWEPDKLSLSLDAMHQAEQQYPNKPIVIHTDLKVVDSQLKLLAPSFWQYSNLRPDLLDTHLRYLAISNSVTGCTMLFNQHARTCALPFSNKAYMHDAWIALQVKRSGGILIPLYQTPIAYRQHQDNALGAVKYSIWTRSLKTRVEDAKRSYSMSHPDVFANILTFIGWKIIYFCHRSCTKR